MQTPHPHDSLSRPIPNFSALHMSDGEVRTVLDQRSDESLTRSATLRAKRRVLTTHVDASMVCDHCGYSWGIPNYDVMRWARRALAEHIERGICCCLWALQREGSIR